MRTFTFKSQEEPNFLAWIIEMMENKKVIDCYAFIVKNPSRLDEDGLSIWFSPMKAIGEISKQEVKWIGTKHLKNPDYLLGAFAVDEVTVTLVKLGFPNIDFVRVKLEN
jgi:hypothetical protein